MATIKDVAREAGVSIATVSNYLNRTKPVSKEKAKAIQTAIEDLKYSHNILARNFRIKNNQDIGVILPDLDDSYYMQIFQGIKSYFQNGPYTVHVEFSRNIPEFEKNIAENFLKKQVCGLILVSCQPNNWKFYYDNFTSQGTPIVLLERKIHSLDANFVSINNYKLVKQMTENLLRKGHRNICLVTGPQEYSSEEDCARGFTDACTNYGISISSNQHIVTDMSKEDAFRKIIKRLRKTNWDAIITTSETLAAGVVEGLILLNGGTQDVPIATLSEERWNYHTHINASEFGIRMAIKLGRTASSLLKKQLEESRVRETEKIMLDDFHIRNVTENTLYAKKVAEMKPRKLRVLLMVTQQVNALLGMIKNFENLTGIEVETVAVDYHEYYDTIMRGHEEGEQPYDVFMYSMSWLPYFASEHMLYDVSDDVLQLKGIFFDNALEFYGAYQGRYYGIPFLYGPQVLYYRKDLFEDPVIQAEYEKVSSISLRPPATLKEYNSIADFFTNKTDVIPYGVGMPAAYSACLIEEVYLRLLAFGAMIFDEKGNVCFDSEQTLKAYINLMRTVKFANPNYRQTNDTQVVDMFMNGETAMLITYPTNFMDVTDLRKSSAIGSIGYHIVPGRVPLLGGWGLGISSKSEQKEEAMEFLHWICDEQIANYMTLLGGQPAVTSAYTNDALVELYPWLQLYHSINQYAKPIIPPTLPNGKVIQLHEIEQIIGKWVYELLDSDMEVHEAIKNTHRELEELVEKYMNMV